MLFEDEMILRLIKERLLLLVICEDVSYFVLYNGDKSRSLSQGIYYVILHIWGFMMKQELNANLTLEDIDL